MQVTEVLFQDNDGVEGRGRNGWFRVRTIEMYQNLQNVEVNRRYKKRVTVCMNRLNISFYSKQAGRLSAPIVLQIPIEQADQIALAILQANHPGKSPVEIIAETLVAVETKTPGAGEQSDTVLPSRKVRR